MCLKYAAEQNDIIVCLPTGYGKSLLFEVLPYMEKVSNKREPSIALIVIPLYAIIDVQLHKLGDDCVRVDPAAIGNVAVIWEEIHFGSPRNYIRRSYARYFTIVGTAH